MSAKMFGNRVDAGLFPKANCDPARLLERLAIELRPARRTRVGQPALGHHDAVQAFTSDCQSMRVIERFASSRYPRPSC
jgi:hypothetical protein